MRLLTAPITARQTGRGIITGPAPGAGAGAETIVYLLRDEFTTPDAAPITSPRTCEPGPETLTLTDTIDSYAIASGEFIGSANGNAARDPWLRNTAGFARGAGIDFACQFRIITISPSNAPSNSLGWVDTLSTPASNRYGGLELYSTATILRLFAGGTPTLLVGALSKDVDYKVHFPLRTAGMFCVIDGNLYYVSSTNTTATLYPSWQANTSARPPFAFDDWSVMQLGSPWDTDDGIATNVVASPSNGEVTTSEQDAIVEFTWTPQAAETLTIYFRRTDDDNTMKLECDQAAGTIKLFKREGAADTEQDAGKTQTWTVDSDYRVLIIFKDQSIRTHVNDVDKHSATVDYNTSVTGVKASGFASGSNLKTWPVVLSGAALTELNRFLA